MNTARTRNLLAASLAGALAATAAFAAAAPKMKMTTPIPQSITTPDSVETRLGTLKGWNVFFRLYARSIPGSTGRGRSGKSSLLAEADQK